MRGDLRLAQRPRAFDPASLFRGAAGALYAPRPGTVFQDAGGTIPARIGDPVGRLADLSGNGNHATQAVAASRPVLAAGAAGYPYLRFDGVDDSLRCLFAVAGFDRVSALRLEGSTIDNQLLGGGNANTGVLVQHGPAPGLAIYSGKHVVTVGPGIGGDGVIAERHRGLESSLRADGGAASGAVAAGDAGTSPPGGITIGAYMAGTYNSAMRLYALLMIGRALDAVEMGAARRWAGKRAGISL